MPGRKIVKITKDYFETEDGKQHPVLFEFDETPSIKEFQQQYDQWLEVFQSKKLLEHEPEIT